MDSKISPLIALARDVGSDLYKFSDGLQDPSGELDCIRLEVRCTYGLLRRLHTLTKPAGATRRNSPIFSEEATDSCLVTFIECDELLRTVKGLLWTPLIELQELSQAEENKGKLPNGSLPYLIPLEEELDQLLFCFEDIKKDLALHILIATLHLAPMGNLARVKASPFAGLRPAERLGLAAYLWQEKQARTSPRGSFDSSRSFYSTSDVDLTAPLNSPTLEPIDEFEAEAEAEVETDVADDSPIYPATEEDPFRNEKRDSAQSEAAVTREKQEKLRMLKATKATIELGAAPPNLVNDLASYESLYRTVDADAAPRGLLGRFPSSASAPAWRLEPPKMSQIKKIPPSTMDDIQHQISLLRADHNMRTGKSRTGPHSIERRRVEMNMLKEQINVRIYNALIVATDREEQTKSLGEAVQLHRCLSEAQTSTVDEVLSRKAKRRSQDLARLIEQDQSAASSTRLPQLEHSLVDIMSSRCTDDDNDSNITVMEESLAMRAWLDQLQDEVDDAHIDPLHSHMIVGELMERWTSDEDLTNTEDIFYRTPDGWVEEAPSPTYASCASKSDPMQDYDGGWGMGLR